MRLIGLMLAVTAALFGADPARAITFTPGHIYATTWTSITEFDAAGNRLGSLSPSGSQLWNGAFGRDGLFYVTRWDGTVQSIRADGSVVRTYSVPGVGSSVQASIAFDPSGENFYVSEGGAVYKFNVGSPTGTAFAVPGSLALATMPNGDVLTTTGSNLRRFSSSGELVGYIGDGSAYGPGFLEDPHDVTADPLLMLSNVRGIAYDPALDRTFIFQMGYGGGDGDYFHQLFALSGTTNELLDVTRFDIGSNLVMGNNGQLVSGGFRSPGGIFDAATLELVTRLTLPSGEDFTVAVMPVPEPAVLLVALALLVSRSACRSRTEAATRR